MAESTQSDENSPSPSGMSRLLASTRFRKLTWYLVAIGTLLLIAGSCTALGVVLKRSRQSSSSGIVGNGAITDSVLKSRNNFCLSIFALVSQNRTNIFASPTSIVTVLGLLRLAARPESIVAREIDQVLENHPHDPIPQINEGSMRSVSSLWADGTVRPSYIDQAKTLYNVEARKLPTSIDPVNEWIKNNTDGKIKSPVASIPAGTDVLLVNAIYFRGTWAVKFPKANTWKATFFTGHAATLVTMMRLGNPTLRYGMLRTETTCTHEILEIPFDNPSKEDKTNKKLGISALIVLPCREMRLDDFIVQAHKDKAWEQWTNSLPRKGIKLSSVSIPRFKLTTPSMSFVEPLKSLGIKAIFDRADGASPFPEMLREPRGKAVSEISQSAAIEVDEDGATAAAATVASVGTKTGSDAKPTFLADRPFLFAIMETSRSNLLFIGRVDEPLPNGWDAP